MRIQRYKAPTMQDALEMVRGELGEDAMILSTRTVEPKLRLLGRSCVEVVAAISGDRAAAGGDGCEVVGDRPGPGDGCQVTGDRGSTAEAEGAASALSPTTHHLPPEAGLSPVTGHPSPEAGLSPVTGHLSPGEGLSPVTGHLSPGEGLSPVTGHLSPHLAELRDMKLALASLAAWATPRLDIPCGVAAHFVDAGMSADLARELAGAAEGVGPEGAWAAVAGAIAARIAVSGPIHLAPAPDAGTNSTNGRRHTAGPRVVALVGPTGVGKTTVLAKLAARYALVEHRRVGLVSLDTYRVGASEQIRTYADMLEVPVEIAARPEEVPVALARMRDRELVLVDTVGHGPRDEENLRRLGLLLAAANPDEVHLVLAAPAERRSMAAALEGFAELAPSHVLFTKLDEAQTCGAMVELAIRAGLPVSYVSDGQEVPERITPAAPERLAASVCPEDTR